MSRTPYDTKYRVQSVDRAIDVVDVLAAATGPLTLTEIAAATGGSKSAIFTTVQTLCARGWVRSTGTGFDRTYTLGLALARLGDIALAQVSFRDLARPVLRELTERTGLTSRAAIWGEDCAIVIDRVDGEDRVRFDLRMGQREALHRSGVGKAMLSAMSDDDVRATLAGLHLEARTPHSLTTIEALLADLHRSRERGYATDDEEDAVGIICIGAPVIDHRGERAGALSVTGIKAGITTEDIERTGQQVAAGAAKLSHALGHRRTP